jgi:hypothetical protein
MFTDVNYYLIVIDLSYVTVGLMWIKNKWNEIKLKRLEKKQFSLFGASKKKQWKTYENSWHPNQESTQGPSKWRSGVLIPQLTFLIPLQF